MVPAWTLGESDPNDGLDDFFDFVVTNLSPSQVATIEAAFGKPGSTVYFLVSTTGQDPTSFMGQVVDLSYPILLLGSSVVAPSSLATMSHSVPASVQTGTATYWQAVETFYAGGVVIHHSDPVIAVVN